MQHPDEGTIHSWLDGALSADEAARVEAHVKECPECAAAVAEARGFIAASSRILTALDNVPRGVAPVTASRRRVAPFAWRVAATLLVAATGTLVVIRSRVGSERPTSFSADSAVAPSSPTVALSGKAGTPSPRSDITMRENKVVSKGTAPRADRRVAESDFAGAAPPATPSVPLSRATDAVAMDAAAEPEPLKVVGNPRRLGEKVTLYEIAPGDTVTLTESTPVVLGQVVTTGIAEARVARQATGKSSLAPSKTRVDAAIATAPDSQRGAAGVPSSPAAASAPAPSQREMASTIHTIRWTDPATGNALTLTGRVPEARLQEIRIRIERERAAAAAKQSP